MIEGVNQMAKGTQTRKKTKKGMFIPYMEAAAAPSMERQANEATATNARRDIPGHDFWTVLSANELARSQGVQPIRRVGQIRAFSEPDPSEADWLAREVRRWRREGGRTQRRNRR
jgi:hypothetical protein